MEEIWKPGIASARRRDAIEWEKWESEDPNIRPSSFKFTSLEIDAIETEYIVVGPITSDLDVATGKTIIAKQEQANLVAQNRMVYNIIIALTNSHWVHITCTMPYSA